MPQLLVSNDDGVHAPGLLTLVRALAAAGLPPHVAAPDQERSATGHGISVHGALFAHPLDVPGAVEAYAVSGLPADTVMLALSEHACLFSSLPTPFRPALVLSGVNRGDNLGFHTIYSGTVAAAREAALKGVPAVALSLDSHSRGACYEAAARVAVSLAAALLARPAALAALSGVVVNVNVPDGPLAAMRGFALCHTSTQCTRPGFVALPPARCPVGARGWANSAAGGTRVDARPGGDAAAVGAGFVAVALVPVTAEAAPPPRSQPPPALPPGFGDAAVAALVEALAAAAAGGGFHAQLEQQLQQQQQQQHAAAPEGASL